MSSPTGVCTTYAGHVFITFSRRTDGGGGGGSAGFAGPSDRLCGARVPGVCFKIVAKLPNRNRRRPNENVTGRAKSFELYRAYIAVDPARGRAPFVLQLFKVRRPTVKSVTRPSRLVRNCFRNVTSGDGTTTGCVCYCYWPEIDLDNANGGRRGLREILITLVTKPARP